MIAFWTSAVKAGYSGKWKVHAPVIPHWQFYINKAGSIYYKFTLLQIRPGSKQDVEVTEHWMQREIFSMDGCHAAIWLWGTGTEFYWLFSSLHKWWKL